MTSDEPQGDVVYVTASRLVTRTGDLDELEVRDGLAIVDQAVAFLRGELGPDFGAPVWEPEEYLYLLGLARHHVYVATGIRKDSAMDFSIEL